jgi:hypothetical protein
MDFISRLAEEVGAVRSGLPFDPLESRPLLNIEGNKNYRDRLSKVAYDLHNLLQHDTSLQDAKGQSVVLDGHNFGELPNLRKAMTKTNDGPALEVILHSLAHIGSAPLQREGKGKKSRIRRQTCLAVPMEGRGLLAVGPIHLHSPSIRKYILGLIQYGWLDVVPSHFDARTGNRYMTRIRPTETFFDWMLQNGLIFAWHPYGEGHSLSKNKAIKKPSKALTSLLWLSKKDHDDNMDKKTRERIPAVLLTRDLIGDENILPKLNEMLNKQKVECSLTFYAEYVDLYDYNKGRPKNNLGGHKDLYRQFSQKDGRGGRLFGPWVQKLPSKYRTKLTIDGKPTVELDYSSMQLVLLYAVKGVQLPDYEDLYALPSMIHPRDDMKMVLTRSVGNLTRAGTIGSIKKFLRDQGRRTAIAKKLYDDFWIHHADVCPHENGLSDAAWTELQNLESRVALRILAKLVNQGISAIPIHDSFIVLERYAEVTERVMHEAFQELCPGLSIGIKRTPPRHPL